MRNSPQESSPNPLQLYKEQLEQKSLKSNTFVQTSSNNSPEETKKNHEETHYELSKKIARALDEADLDKHDTTWDLFRGLQKEFPEIEMEDLETAQKLRRHQIIDIY